MLTWNDLVIEPLPQEKAVPWLVEWAFALDGPLFPVLMTKFGDWMLQRPNGSTVKLSVLEGTLTPMAETKAEFEACMNDEAWQDEHLLPNLVGLLQERGHIPGPGQCFGFTPHPSLSHTIIAEDAMVFDIGIWQNLCAQTFFQSKGSN